MATGPGHMAPGRLGWQQGLSTWHHGGFFRLQYPATWHQKGWDGNRAWPYGTREAGMATGPLVWLQCPATWHKGGWDGNRVWPKAPGHLVLRQGLSTWHQSGWDCNRAWPHSTRLVGMATGPGHVAEGGWDGYRVCPHGTREAAMANRAWPHGTVEAGMLTVLLVWLQCPEQWHNGSWDGNRVWLTAPGSLGWQQGLATCLQGG